MTQHESLPPESWARFDLGQQILQIAAEMQRALKFLRVDRSDQLHGCYERALGLVDLTIQVQADPHLRRELVPLRDLIAQLLQRAEPDSSAHRQALRALLHLHPVSAEQVAILGL
ncbi:MAG: hypothetical protein ACKVXR_17060 [Planctomycetota bacterium]